MQTKKRQIFVGGYFLCALYRCLYRNINPPPHFEFYRDTSLILAKSGIRLRSGVLFGSKSRGLRQCGRLSSSASSTVCNWFGHSSDLFILTSAQDQQADSCAHFKKSFKKSSLLPGLGKLIIFPNL